MQPIHRSARLLRALGAGAAIACLLPAGTALACNSDQECKAPRVCVEGACVNPPAAATPATCDKDIDCPGQTVCDGHQCVPMTPTLPGEQELSPPAAQPPPANPSGLEISPLRPASPLEASPLQANPPPAPPPPPPEAPPPVQPLPPTPPHHAMQERRPRLPPVQFDLFAGAAVVWGQATTYTATGLGGGFDGQLIFGVAENVSVGLRGGGSIMPITSTYAFGPTVAMPDWHWGVMLGAANTGIVHGPREWGFEADLPFEYPLGPFFKIGAVLGIGFFSGLTAETLRGEIGF